MFKKKIICFFDKTYSKFFSLYRAIIVVIGFTATFFAASQNLRVFVSDVNAYPYSLGQVVNIYDAGCPPEMSDWDTRSRGGYNEEYRCNKYACDGSKNATPEDENDCFLVVFRCEEGEEEWHGECGLCKDEANNPHDGHRDSPLYDHITYTDIFTNKPDRFHPSHLPTDCLMVQIDLVCGHDNEWNTYDWIVWKGNRFGDDEACRQTQPVCGNGLIETGEECDPPGNTEQCTHGACQDDCTCPDVPEPTCYFNGNAVKTAIGESSSIFSWIDLSQNSGSATSWGHDNFYIGAIASDRRYPVGQYSLAGEDDAVLTVTGPNGYFSSESCTSLGEGSSNYDCTMGPIPTSSLAAGIYTVTLLVNEHADDPDCASTGYFEVEGAPPEEITDFTVVKAVRDDNHYYDAKDEVLFDIAIENTGGTIIDQMSFLDEYDENYLKFLDISGVRVRGGSQLQSTNLKTQIDPQNPNGAILISDLTESLGDLGVGEKYIITVQFETLSVSHDIQTLNYVTVETVLGKLQGNDWIVISGIALPITDK